MSRFSRHTHAPPTVSLPPAKQFGLGAAHLDPADVELVCPGDRCGIRFVRDRQAFAEATGEHVGCPGCGVWYRVPKVEPLPA